MLDNVIEIKSEIMINVNVRAKKHHILKKIIFGILLYAAVKMKKIEQVHFWKITRW